jgi:hypothetical protein
MMSLTHMLTWRRAGWLFSVMTSMLGLTGLAYLAWATRHGHPTGPAGAIVAGFILYSALTVRAIAGAGLLLFKPRATSSTAAIASWLTGMLALWWLDLPPYDAQARVMFGVWCLIAGVSDLWLLSHSRPGSSSLK